MSDVTANRLRSYYPFSDHVVGTVAEFTDRQRAKSHYADVLEDVGIVELTVITYPGYLPIAVLDIVPGDCDPKNALVVHLPMANPLDPNQMFQLATIAGTNPNRRIISAGNPSGDGYTEGRLTRSQRRALKRGELWPLTDPVLRYLNEESIASVDETGFSLGALVAVASAARANQPVHNIVPIEPVRGDRSLVRLLKDFHSTTDPISDYVNAANLPAYLEARRVSVGEAAYVRGLLRLTNIAVARMLRTDRFVNETDNALNNNPACLLTAIWGSESELALDGLMSNCVAALGVVHCRNRVRGFRLEGQTHAMANDPSLHAALILEATK